MVNAGDEIVCSNGHACGRFLVDVRDGDSIPVTEPAPFSPDVKSAQPDGINTPHPKWVCATCNEPIACLRDGAWRIRTKSGWVG
jgi:hypothetical protein